MPATDYLIQINATLSDCLDVIRQIDDPIPPQLAATLVGVALDIASLVTMRIDFSQLNSPPPNPPVSPEMARRAILQHRLDRIKQQAANHNKEV